MPIRLSSLSIVLTAVLVSVSCSDSGQGDSSKTNASQPKSVEIPLGQWVEVSPDDPEAVKALQAVNRSPHAKLLSARAKAEQNFLHFELVYQNVDSKWKIEVARQRWKMINIRELPEGGTGGTLVPTGEDTPYQLLTRTSLREPPSKKEAPAKKIEPETAEPSASAG